MLEPKTVSTDEVLCHQLRVSGMLVNDITFSSHNLHENLNQFMIMLVCWHSCLHVGAHSLNAGRPLVNKLGSQSVERTNNLQCLFDNTL